MTSLELLAPARNASIGIAAIDCGADAVYIAGPFFGARKDAGNSIEDIAALCAHAHKFGARIFVTVNITVREEELQELHSQMLAEQAAGVDAFIVRDPRIFGWKDITVPLHASTQCAIRTPEDARRYEALGASRLVLERQLSLEQVRAIRKAVGCELEFFVHGALCVGYSGECRLSEHLNSRSADRGECIQACRSLYDLVDSSGKVLVRDKALLSLKDYNLHERLAELADAGICSFKIEGRLKSESYVRNITAWYSKALDELTEAAPERYCRASFGRVSAGFEPDPAKSFNRGYTQLLLDGKRSSWSSMDAPKNIGESVGVVRRLQRIRGGIEITLKPVPGGVDLHNGDGFAFVSGAGITGFRGDVCEGLTIRCRPVEGLREGTRLFRNIDALFEKGLERSRSIREIPVRVDISISGRWKIALSVHSQDGREFTDTFNADVDTAENRPRAEQMLREQLGKRASHYIFTVGSLIAGELPLLSASTINTMRRLLAEDLDRLECGRVGMLNAPRPDTAPQAQEASGAGSPLMRSKYCIRYELGMCPVHQGAKEGGPLFLLNNGRRLALRFDCKACEMSVEPAK